VYIADFSNHLIRKVTVSTGIITTIAGSGGTGSYSGDNGQATSATLNYPRGVALDSSGNVYIADTSNSRIRKVEISTGVIFTIAGTGSLSYNGDNGQATAVALNYPRAVDVDSAGIAS
jgi:sugar lactone lactonase YvrE